MTLWSPWATLSREGMAVKATFVTVVLLAAATSFLDHKVATNESNMLSLAEQFVNEASMPVQKEHEMTTSAQLRRLEENKRKDRKRASMETYAAAAEDCTSHFCQKQLSDACLVQYKVNNVVPSTITMVLVCEGSRWVGIGFSESGNMMNSDAVIGSPAGSVAEKYRLGGYDQSSVVAMEKRRQTLIDASVKYDDADDVTVLKFTKIMKEEGEVEIKPGKNTFLYAKGIFEDLNYHQERDLFELTIPEVNAAAVDGEEESSEKKRKDRDKVKKDDDSAEDSSAAEVKQPQESKRKQAKTNGGQTLAEQFAKLGPIQLRPLKDLRPQFSPPVPAGDSNDDFPYPYPKVRFIEWGSLSPQTREIMMENFGYSKGNWNALGQNENERKTCSDLTDRQRQAIQLLGWNCDVWDCFINHYKSYDANQLEENKLIEHVDVVRSAWVKLWADLSELELQSATRLCFTETTWDVGYLGSS